MKDILNNEELSNYIMFKLDRLDKNIKEEDLLLIDELVLDNNTDLKVLKYFKNIKTITLRNYNITIADFYIIISLINLEDITFEKCRFNNANIIAGLPIKSLSIINCEINNYDFIYIIDKLERLEIINGIVNITKLNRLNNLVFLVLSYSKIIDPNHNIMLDSLEELHIDNTNIKDISIVNNLKKLEYLSIDENQIKENKELIIKLQNKNINIYEEDMQKVGDNYD